MIGHDNNCKGQQVQSPYKGSGYKGSGYKGRGIGGLHWWPRKYRFAPPIRVTALSGCQISVPMYPYKEIVL